MKLSYNGVGISLDLTHTEFLILVLAVGIVGKKGLLEQLPFDVSSEQADTLGTALTDAAAKQGVPSPTLNKERMYTSSTAFMVGISLMKAQAELDRNKLGFSGRNPAACEDCGADPDDICEECHDARSNDSAG